MADVEKAEKLAAARRRLEDFQKNKKKPAEHHVYQMQPVEPFSGQSFGPNPTVPPIEGYFCSEDTRTPPTDPNLNSVAQYHASPPPDLNLNSVPQYQTQHPDSNLNSVAQYQTQPNPNSLPQYQTQPPDPNLNSVADYPGNIHNPNSVTSTTNEPIGNIPEAPFTPSIFNANVFLDSSKPVSGSPDWLQGNTSDFPGSPNENASLQSSPSHFPNEETFQNGDRSPILKARVPFTPAANSQVLLNGRSNSESLRLLAEQMTELCEDASSRNSPALEKRVQDLEVVLAAERSNNQQLQIHLKESQSRCAQLETKVAELRTESELTLAQRIGPLQEQLRAHAQTVGILVGEKTALEAALARHEATAEQRTGEMQELHNRLRASRHKVNELEKELSAHTSKTQLNERQMQIYTQEQDRLKRENSVLSKQLEDVKEEASELKQKLNAKISEVSRFEETFEEQQKQLSLAQLRVTQLSGVESPVMTSEVEALHQQKFALEKRCSELTESLRVLGVEREQAAEQYQQYVAQLNAQVHSLSQKMDHLVSENGGLRTREEELVFAMSELERQLQQTRKAQPDGSDPPNRKSIEKPEVESTDVAELEAEIETLRLENDGLRECLQTKEENIAELRDEVEDSKAQICDLEAAKGDQPDQSRLLAAMESDKVAAAQATAQNAKLKDQVQELQQAFIKISNDKLQLTENLENEKRVNLNMGEKIACLAEELHELRLLVSQRDRELEDYRGHKHRHEVDHHHQSGTTDDDHHQHDDCHHHEDNVGHDHNHHSHPEHYHSHESEEKRFPNGVEPGTDPTQGQGRGLSQDITEPANSNASLRCLLPQKSTESHESGSSSSITDGATTDDCAPEPHSRVCMESHGMHNSYLSLQGAMEQLQARFTRTMSEYADLADEKQKLEHLVLQLQGETETIGEYVALYQIQRAALQQRAREKDYQLACLSEEREALRKKLSCLSDLVCRLVEEKKHFMQENSNQIDPQNYPAESAEENTTEDMSHPEKSNGSSIEGSPANTAGEILALLNEIGTSSLVDNRMPESFHPCPWCSGRLITV